MPLNYGAAKPRGPRRSARIPKPHPGLGLPSAQKDPVFAAGYTGLTAIPTNGAFSDLSFCSNDEVALFAGGKPIAPQGAISSLSTGFSDLPQRSELRPPVLQPGKATICEHLIFTSLHLDAQAVAIRVRFSWRGSPQTFDFQHVPVAYRRADHGT